MRSLTLLPAMIAMLAGAVHAQRTVEYVLRSSSLPALTVRVASGLVYLGAVQYEVGGVAHAEEHLFADTAGGRLKRVFIAHFEHFLPTNTHTFKYPTMRMTRLGREKYLHQVWAIRDFDLFTVPEVQGFLRERRLTAEASWLVDRYVRAVDSAGKFEVIFFYLEAASTQSAAIHYGGAPSEPPPPPAPPPAVEAMLLRHAAEAFTVDASPGR